jgi:hypothetical protein
MSTLRPDEKRCTICGNVKDIDEFYRKPNGVIRSECKACHNIKDRRSGDRKVVYGIFRTDEPFPEDDFLKYRRMACAYRDHRSGKIVRAVNNWYQHDAYEKLRAYNRLIVVLPPGHIKTTMFAIEYPTWKIMGNRDMRITCVQKNQEEAKKLINAVQTRLSDYSYYEELREELYTQGDRRDRFVNPLHDWFRHKHFQPKTRKEGTNWGAYGFRVAGTRSGEKDLTMEAKGIGSQIQGVRADLIILDDIQSPEMAVRSPKDSADKLRWFQDVILGRVTGAQQIVVLCNFFSPDDFAHRLIGEVPGFEIVQYPALIPEDGPGGVGKMVPLCPEFWTPEDLDFKRLQVGPQTWFYTWMQETGSYETRTFRREALEEARDPTWSLGEVPVGTTDIYLGVDPAAASSGYCAMLVLGLNRKTKQRYIIDIFNKPGMRTWQNVIAQIEDFCRTYPIRKVIVEGNNTQKAGLTEDPNFQKMLRSLGTRWEVYQSSHGSGARSLASNFDITVIGGLYDAGLISIGYGGDHEQNARVDAYIDQACAWRTDPEGRSVKNLVRDMVMAHLFAESEAFVMANRAELPPPVRRPVPRWVRKRWDELQEHSVREEEEVPV